MDIKKKPLKYNVQTHAYLFFFGQNIRSYLISCDFSTFSPVNSHYDNAKNKIHQLKYKVFMLIIYADLKNIYIFYLLKIL